MTSPSSVRPVRSTRSAAVAAEPESPARRSVSGLAAAVAAALALASGWAVAQESSALTQQELNQINNRPIAPAARSQLNQPREPSFQLNERDGTQVREYRDKGRATDIQVRSGFGTRYEMSKPEDSSPKIREHDVNRVPSVNLKF
ncbi:hypothetical protein [Cupriavidus sp. MP-37]|uniref:hypothetical protein n=1 Tax=Cupriavidus sp. MP-37 TaxID=2884455 RepID=UPI001D0B69FD|nr:hypothetical protein [Cupriavidus sp. MP-37]UDM51362.1 hypothetical protein LIN44_06090 [Cupriavidus sp. MP-37]